MEFRHVILSFKEVFMIMQKIWLETKYNCLACWCLWFLVLLEIPSWCVLLASSLTHFLPWQERQALVIPLTSLFFLEQLRVRTFALFWHAHIDQHVMFMACGAERALAVYSGLFWANCLWIIVCDYMSLSRCSCIAVLCSFRHHEVLSNHPSLILLLQVVLDFCLSFRVMGFFSPKGASFFIDSVSMSWKFTYSEHFWYTIIPWHCKEKKSKQKTPPYTNLKLSMFLSCSNCNGNSPLHFFKKQDFK